MDDDDETIDFVAHFGRTRPMTKLQQLRRSMSRKGPIVVKLSLPNN